ncbi:hypothetical protein F4V90_32005, partial [Neorhizobium galegae]
RMNAFCASENCDAFIVFRSFPSQENAPENSNQNRSSLKGSDQAHIIPSELRRFDGDHDRLD